MNNFMVSAGAHINFTAPVAGPRKFRVEKKRKETKRVKRLSLESPEGLVRQYRYVQVNEADFCFPYVSEQKQLAFGRPQTEKRRR